MTSDPPHDRDDDRSTPPADAGRDTLDALQALEHMLARRHGLADEAPPEPSGVEQDQDGQYRIPLLDEVVGAAAPAARASELPPSTELSPVARRLFDRLASEIDVIVQSGVDEALRTAAKTVRARIKQHVSIVLPEILDELAHEEDERNRR